MADAAIDSRRLRRILRRLLDIYSPSGKEEEAVAFLQGFFRRQGLPFRLQAVDEHRNNLLVLPPGGDVRLALVGHLDTVAAYDLDEYGYQQEGDLVRGLGSADMKGGCAAMIEAFLTAWQTGPAAVPAALCLVVGEEEEGDGVEALLEEHHFSWALIGEPTGLQPCLSHYGYLEVQLESVGRRRHASLANAGKNPVEAMLRLMLRISGYLEKTRPDLVCNIRDLFSSQAGFAVPERCEAWLDLHLPPLAPVGQILTELEEIAVREQPSWNGVSLSLRAMTVHAGYELPEKGSLIDLLRATFATQARTWQPQAFRSHSDANQLWAAGVKPILLGPGELEKAHSPEESVSFRQVVEAAEVYLGLLRSLKPAAP